LTRGVGRFARRRNGGRGEVAPPRLIGRTSASPNACRREAIPHFSSPLIPVEAISMAATIYYDNDADLSHLKNKTIAILGYGSQGHAQAQNLKDSGCTVIIGQRKGGPNYDLAVKHGFEPMPIEEATRKGDVGNILLPDEAQGDLYREVLRPNLK